MKKNVSNQGVKRPGSTNSIAFGSPKKQSRKLVEVSEDTWLDVLKHLSCPKWSKMRLVSRQLNGMVQRNVSRLPLVVIDNVAMKKRLIYSTRRQKETEIKMIVTDSNISPDDQAQWFKDRATTIDVPEDIQLNSAIIGVDLKENCCVDLCVLGPSQAEELIPYEKIQPWFFGQQFKAEVLFYAEFSPHRNKYSWASMAFFLKLLYDQSTYVKELSMYSLDKKLKDVLFPDGLKRYIRCGFFTPQAMKNANELCNFISRLEQNVQADTIQLSKGVRYDRYEFCIHILSAFWGSANQTINLGHVGDLPRFFRVLIKKFRINTTVHSIFPIILLSGSRRIRNDPLEESLSGKDIIRNGNYSNIYTISNGRNRMRIEFVREPEKPRDPNVVYCRYGYGYDIRVTVEASE